MSATAQYPPAYTEQPPQPAYAAQQPQGQGFAQPYPPQGVQPQYPQYPQPQYPQLAAPNIIINSTAAAQQTATPAPVVVVGKPKHYRVRCKFLLL